MQDNEMPPYAVGPYRYEVDAEAEAESESSQTYGLLTIDAKNEKYQAVDCYWTQELPKDAITITTVPDDSYFDVMADILDLNLSRA